MNLKCRIIELYSSPTKFFSSIRSDLTCGLLIVTMCGGLTFLSGIMVNGKLAILAGENSSLSQPEIDRMKTIYLCVVPTLNVIIGSLVMGLSIYILSAFKGGYGGLIDSLTISFMSYAALLPYFIVSALFHLFYVNTSFVMNPSNRSMAIGLLTNLTLLYQKSSPLGYSRFLIYLAFSLWQLSLLIVGVREVHKLSTAWSILCRCWLFL